MSDLIELQEWAKKQKWVFAKTYAKTAPHEYLVLKTLESEEDRKMFFELARRIFDQGYMGQFWTKEYKYYDMDGYKYWSMDRTVEETELINRERLGAN